MSCLLLKEQKGQVFGRQNFCIFHRISVFFGTYQPAGTGNCERHPCKYPVASDLVMATLERDLERPQRRCWSLLEALLTQNEVLK